jgi:hypothetical protein
MSPPVFEPEGGIEPPEGGDTRNKDRRIVERCSIVHHCHGSNPRRALSTPWKEP